MVAAANLVEVAALVGDTARATILAALMGGQSLTGGELAFFAGVSRSTASEHLAKLVGARLVAVKEMWRFHCYRIASPPVASMLESTKAAAAIKVPPRYRPRSARYEALRYARTCHDHIAGRLGVASCGTSSPYPSAPRPVLRTPPGISGRFIEVSSSVSARDLSGECPRVTNHRLKRRLEIEEHPF
jgi:DNA-binding transcriptional ArsR family regulator